MAYIPLHHKYRPQTFADLVGQEAIATTLSNALRLQKIAPAYLFTGPRGTGKTSSARILAKSLNCMASAVPTAQPCGECDVCRSIALGSALDIIEIDAASNTGVDNIREIIERAQYAPVQCRYKVYIIDECHMLTTAAFNSLLKTLEEPPPHVVFILATTDPQRVLPTIISRCQRFDYRRIPLAAMVGHLTYIAQVENIDIPLAAVTLISQIAQGGLRDAESLLDRLSLLSGEITPDRVLDAVGSVPEQDLLEILQSIARNDPESLLDRTRNILERGKEPLTVLQNLAGCYRDLLIAKTAPQRPDLVALTPETWTELCKLAQTWQISWILAGQQHLKDSEVQIKHTTQPRLWLEITLLGLLSVNTPPTPPVTFTPAIPQGSIPAPPTTTSQVAPAPARSSKAAVTTPTPPESGHPTSLQASLPANQSNELVAIWEKVLQQLLPASKDLFKGFGTLIAITNEQAIVAMKSSTMQQIASGKVPELSKVFSSIFDRPIVVKLEVLGKSQPQAAASSASVTIVPTPPPEIPAPSAIVEPTSLISAPIENLADEDEQATATSAVVPVLPQVSAPVPAIQPPPLPVSEQPPPSTKPPAPKLEPDSTAVELDPPIDFDEPPESFDLERAAQIEIAELDQLEIDPALQTATDTVVKLFHGETIDRQHDLHTKLVSDNEL